jgi:precorrin-2 dehydrogenase/sirohydrochlorin ferrochelatase
VKSVSLFPAFLKLKGRRCLVVGAGRIGEEKIEGLLKAGADVVVVAPQATARVRALSQQKKIRWVARRFESQDFEGAFLVVAATSSPQLHLRIFEDAQLRGVLCNVVDDPPNCDFYYGSVVRRGALQIAISTEGNSPALAQRIRKQLEGQYGKEYELWLQKLGEERERLFAQPIDPDRRKRLLHQLASAESFKTFLHQKGTAKTKRKANRKTEPRN